jgi:hypothetical protein
MVDLPHATFGKRARVIMIAVVLISLLILVGQNTCLDGLPCTEHSWPIKNQHLILEPG